MTNNAMMTTNGTKVKSPASTTRGTKVKSPASVLVVMDEDGAEVVINDATTTNTTTKEQPKIRNSLKSLLDDDTGTPTRQQQGLVQAHPNGGSLYCSNDWQMWSYFGSTGAGADTNGNVKMKEDARKVLRKRFFFSANERRTRMDSVRKDLSPFTLTPTRSHIRVPNKLGSVKSFDLILDHRKQQRNNIPKKAKQNNQTNLSSLVSFCGAACHVEKADSPAVIRSSMLDAIHEDDCYDSDPEDFTRRRLFRENTTSSVKGPGNKENLKSSNNSVKGMRPYQYPVDSEEYMFNSVQEFLNERFTLILHTTGEEGKPCASYAVKAWFERGQHLSSSKVIQPRFMWHKKEKQENIVMWPSRMPSMYLAST